MSAVDKKPQQARARHKRKLLLEAAEVEFAEAGYIGATSKSIADRAGVATGTFYQHFDNKDDVLREIADRRNALLQANLTDVLAHPAGADSQSLHDVLRTALVFIYDFHEQNTALHQVLEERRHVDPDLAAIINSGEDVLQGRVLRFVQSFKIAHPDIVASNLFGMAEGLVHRHVFNLQAYPKEQVIEQGVQMLAAYFLAQRNLTSTTK